MTLFQTFMLAGTAFMVSVSSVQATSNDNTAAYLSLNKGIASHHYDEDLLAVYEALLSSSDDGVSDYLSEEEIALLIDPINDSDKIEKTLEVVATAYTSHAAQTDSTPTIAAWGDRLTPSTKAIAVSRDLLTQYGLKHRTKVRINGLSGEFLVLDKMNKRWFKKIDIYMGMNKRAAFKWGKRNVVMTWKQDAV